MPAAPAGCSLPELELETGQVVKTDEQGSAYYGDIRVAVGSGSVSREAQRANGAPGAMDLQLCAEVAGLGDAEARQAWS